MRHIDLFSGIGGFLLAGRMAWGDEHEPLAMCEIDDWRGRLLQKRFPKTKLYSDVTTADFSPFRSTVDVLSGGFPCQPYSIAGHRRGAEDDRALWPSMLGIIRDVRPRWVVAENVGGLLSMVQWDCELEVDGEGNAIGEAGDTLYRIGQGVAIEILASLFQIGYTVVPPLVLPACSVGAEHRRDRIWIVAYDEKQFDRQDSGESASRQVSKSRESVGETSIPDTMCNRRGSSGGRGAISDEDGFGPGERTEGMDEQSGSCGDGPLSDANGAGCEKQRESKRGRSKLPIVEQPCRWSVEPAVGRVAHGIPDRVDRLRGLGDAIVPQVAVEIFRGIAVTDQVYRQ